MQIRKIDTHNKKDKRQFINFPFQLYKDCVQWVPALLSEMNLALDQKKHPFYRHSDADFFVAESDVKTLGRIAVLHNRNYCAHHKEQEGFIYYFEVIEDIDVANGLLNAAIDWARQRRLNYLLGPKGFLRSSGIGLLIEGFEYPPAIGIPYNFPYYRSFIENIGFQKETDHLSGYMNRSHHFPSRLYTAAARVKERGGFWVKSFINKTDMQQYIPLLNQVHHEAFINNPGYYPSTEEEFAFMAKNIIQIADPRLLKIIMKGDDIAGFIIAYADISEAIQKIKGQMWPFGWLIMLREKKRTRLVNLNGVGLLPKYQGRGANALLYTELEKTLRSFQFERAEFVQIDENNFKSKSDMEKLGVHWHKRHRTYRLSLN